MCFKKSRKIHPINFKKPSKDFKTDECLICLEKIQYDRAALSCGHNYHSKSLTCPMCKEKFRWKWVYKNK